MRQSAPNLALLPPLGEPDQLFTNLKNDTQGYELIALYLKKNVGINMIASQKNFTLMASRLSKILSKTNCSSYTQFLKLVHAQPSIRQELIQAMTTNTTHFFREDAHFEIMQNILKTLGSDPSKKGNRELRIWCAAASTGQEPYSMAMTVAENLPDLKSWAVKFLATDIDENVLRFGAAAVYPESGFESVPDVYKAKYFRRSSSPRFEDKLIVSDQLKAMISFAPFNLLTNPYPFEFKFDLVFCRNVLIYFDRELAADVVKKISEHIRPGGHLFVGHSESGVRRPEGMESVAPGVWRKKVVP